MRPGDRSVDALVLPVPCLIKVGNFAVRISHAPHQHKSLAFGWNEGFHPSAIHEFAYRKPIPRDFFNTLVIRRVRHKRFERNA